MRNIQIKKLLWEFLIMNVGIFIAAISVYFFLVPSGMSMGGTTGLAVIISRLVPLSISTIAMIFNVVLLLLGFVCIGKEFGAKTVYISLIYPVYIALFENLFPNFTSIMQDPVLDMICFIFILSVGSAMLFNINASSGGLDIVAKILNKYFHMDMGKAVSSAGMLIAACALITADVKTMILSMIGTYLNGILLDHMLFGFNMKKRVCVLSDKGEEIRRFILDELHSGATLYEAFGAYDNRPHQEIITIVDKGEYSRLMTFLHKADPNAFVTVYTVNHVIYRPKN